MRYLLMVIIIIFAMPAHSSCDGLCVGGTEYNILSVTREGDLFIIHANVKNLHVKQIKSLALLKLEDNQGKMYDRRWLWEESDEAWFNKKYPVTLSVHPNAKRGVLLYYKYPFNEGKLVLEDLTEMTDKLAYFYVKVVPPIK